MFFFKSLFKQSSIDIISVYNNNLYFEYKLILDLLRTIHSLLYNLRIHKIYEHMTKSINNYFNNIFTIINLTSSY